MKNRIVIAVVAIAAILSALICADNFIKGLQVPAPGNLMYLEPAFWLVGVVFFAVVGGSFLYGLADNDRP